MSHEARMNMSVQLALLTGAFLAAAGCASTRRFAPEDQPPPLPQLDLPAQSGYVSEGSLYADTGSAELIGDFRARHVGDILVIRITERTLGKASADSRIDKESMTTLRAPVLFGYEDNLQGQLGNTFDPALAFQTSSEKSFEGDGETSRASSLSADIAVRVVAIGMGGQMIVSGSKEIKVNRELETLMLTGIVRQEDVGPTNVIASSRVSDLYINYGGKGDVADVTRQGWFQRMLDRIWPF